MRETLADALREHANPANPAAAHPHRDAAARPAAAAENDEDLPLDQLLSFVRQLSTSPSSSDDRDQDPERRKNEKEKKNQLEPARGLGQYLERFEKDKKTVQVPREVFGAAAAVVGVRSEAHERLKRGFGRRYGEEGEGEGEGEKRDQGQQQTRASAAPPPRDEL
ncbi:hypothetical protein JCM1840_004302 [Sporobolomyces johnsonii]